MLLACRGSAQGCCYTSYNSQGSPYNRGLSDPKHQQCGGGEALLWPHAGLSAETLFPYFAPW